MHLSVGKIKEVRDRASAGSATYYQSLLQNGASVSNSIVCYRCSQRERERERGERRVVIDLCCIQSSSIKQIKLDLYRTLPGNRHFKSGGSGVSMSAAIVCL